MSTEKIHDINRYARYLPAACIAALLIFTFRLYGYSYFWLDDFNNLYWVQQWTLGDLLWQLASPSTEYFRPVGMFIYWLALHAFDRDPFPYHLVMWALHTLNVALVYLVLKRLTKSRAGAAVGAMLYAYPPVFSDVFWSFGIIFELAGAALFFSALLLWQRKVRTAPVVLGALALFFLGLKTKEMVITLPALWLAQDLLLRRPFKWKDASYVLLPGLLGAWYGFQKVTQMREPDPGQPYYMDLQGLVMGRGFSYYFNALFGTDIRWQVWSIGFVFVLLVLLALRWRLAAFFQIYVFVSFLPVIFLVNHRDPFYWYFPMLGVCGLGALLTRSLERALASKISEKRLASFGLVVFAALCTGMYFYSSGVTEPRRLWQQGIAREYRSFVNGLRALPSPRAGEILYFRSLPRHVDAVVLRSACQVALRRLDIDAKQVDEFPPGARYRLTFEDSRISEIR